MYGHLLVLVGNNQKFLEYYINFLNILSDTHKYECSNSLVLSWIVLT